MNIKKRLSKFISLLLCFSMTFGNMIPAYATENTNGNSTTEIDGDSISTEERNLEDITVTYKQASTFFVTIPKTIVLDGWKQSTYSVKVSGDIDAEQCVYVAPVDMIDKTENIDFYMKDQATENAKDDVVADVTHKKSHWNVAEVAASHKQDDNVVSAQGLTAGAWRGIFQMEIKLETHVTHKHNYVATITKEPTCTEKGEKTYTCDCGDTYTEEIPAKGHHYVDGECTDCGGKDPNHEHSYTEKVTKAPTCTEKGEKTYTCTCGHSYMEEIPARGHNFENGECTDCGEKDPSHTHSYNEGVVTKEPTCTEKGEKTFTCSECEHTYTEEVEALGHDYPDNSVWENTTNGDYAFVQEGTKWTSNNGGVQSSTATSTWIITLDKDTEYSFKYKVSSEDRYDKLTITLDATTIANAISGAGEEITYTDTLAAGTHTLTATYAKDSSGNRNDDCGYVILEEIPGFTITKEPTCTEKGEKSFTCSRCGHIHTEEIPATGHIYISNVIWESTNNGSYKFVQSGNKWTSNNKGVQSSTAASTWTINLANDAEYSFRYKVSSEPNCDKLTITLDSTTVANAISGVGTEQTYTTTLTAGTHTLTASYVKDSSQDKNDDCGYIILEDTANNMVITKEPTCTEKGEKTFTCSRCGHIYTEEIPATGHNYENHICTNCGETDPNHEHQWKANKDVLEWVRYNPYGRGGWTKNGNTYEATFSADKTDATKSASIDFDIDVPNDVECTYSFTCPYLYKTDSSYYDNACAYLYDLDDSGNTIDTTSNPRTAIFSVKGSGSGNSSGKIFLSRGKHRLSVSYHKGNKSSAVSGTVRITLNSMEVLNHVCDECGQKVAHHYTETIVKEATCVENGEKEYVCETCGYSYTEEIAATGEHNYVNGICTVCGDLNTGVEQIFNVSATTTKQSATSATNPDGHYEVTTLADTYSDNIEILEDMLDGEYLRINYYVYFPTLGTQSYFEKGDNINGLWQVQKYNEEINTWENYYQKNINYDNIKDVKETEDNFNLFAPQGKCFFKQFRLEKGTYRIYCKFYAKSGKCDSYNHPHYNCNVIASLCQRNKE